MIYFGILGSAVLFSTLAAWSSRRWMFYAFAILSVGMFTIPAVIRYGIGLDYLGSYSISIAQIAAGLKTDQEPSFRMVVEFVLEYLPSEHYVFVFYSLLTYLVAAIAFPRKHFNYALSAYLLTYYAFTLSGIRQGLALSFVFCVHLLYFKRQYLLALAMGAIAVFWHSSAAVILPMIVVADLFSRMRLSLFPFVLAALAVVFWAVDSSRILLCLAELTPYARYFQSANGDDVLCAAKVSSGLGYLIPAVMFFVLSTVLVTHPSGRRQTKEMGVMCGMAVLVYALSLHVDIFNRFSIVANSILPFAIVKLARIRRNLRDRACLYFAFCCMIALFCKEIVSDVNYGITPYQTVFDAGMSLW